MLSVQTIFPFRLEGVRGCCVPLRRRRRSVCLSDGLRKRRTGYRTITTHFNGRTINAHVRAPHLHFRKFMTLHVSVPVLSLKMCFTLPRSSFSSLDLTCREDRTENCHNGSVGRQPGTSFSAKRRTRRSTSGKRGGRGRTGVAVQACIEYSVRPASHARSPTCAGIGLLVPSKSRASWYICLSHPMILDWNIFTMSSVTSREMGTKLVKMMMKDQNLRKAVRAGDWGSPSSPQMKYMFSTSDPAARMPAYTPPIKHKNTCTCVYGRKRKGGDGGEK